MLAFMLPKKFFPKFILYLVLSLVSFTCKNALEFLKFSKSSCVCLMATQELQIALMKPTGECAIF
jgi:hypothetical protein